MVREMKGKRARLTPFAVAGIYLGYCPRAPGVTVVWIEVSPKAPVLVQKVERLDHESHNLTRGLIHLMD